jgi:hypothetical protein
VEGVLELQRAPDSRNSWQQELLQLLQGWQRLEDQAHGRSHSVQAAAAAAARQELQGGQQGRRLLDAHPAGGSSEQRPAGLGGGALLAARSRPSSGGSSSNTTGAAQQLLMPQLGQGPAGQLLQLWLNRSSQGAADAWALGPSPGQGPAAWKAGCLCELQGEPVCDPATGRRFPSRCYAECQVRAQLSAPPRLPGARADRPRAQRCAHGHGDRCNRPAAPQGIASPGPCEDRRQQGARPLAGPLGQLLAQQLPGGGPALAQQLPGGGPALAGKLPAPPAPPPDARAGSSSAAAAGGGAQVQDTSLLGPLLEVLQGASDQLGLGTEDTVLLYYDADADTEVDGGGAGVASAAAISRAAVAGRRRAARARLAGFAAAAAQRAAAGAQQGPGNSTLLG